MNKVKMKEVIRKAIKEDIGSGDITTDSIIKKDKKGKGEIIAKEKAIVAGLKPAKSVFKEIDSNTKFEAKKEEGELVNKMDEIAEVEGNIRSILKAERLALNFLQRMSGIATKTKR